MKISPKRYAQALYQATVGAKPEEREGIVQHFIELLARQNKLSQINSIIAEFSDYANEQQGVVPVEAITARELPRVRQEMIETQLEKVLQSSVAVRFEIDPTILGGIIIKVSDTIIDGSVKRAISDLRESLVS